LTTPNKMPQSISKLKEQLVYGLIAISPSAWERKSLARDDAGKEVVETQRVVRSVLRHSFAQNVSEENVERLANRWIK